MACEHDLADMDTAAHADGLCPLCLRDRIDELENVLDAKERAHVAVDGKRYGPQAIRKLEAEIAELRQVSSTDNCQRLIEGGRRSGLRDDRRAGLLEAARIALRVQAFSKIAREVQSKIISDIEGAAQERKP